MDCDAFRDEMMDLLYGEAAPATARRLEEHQSACGPCREELASFRRLRRDLSAWRVPADLGQAPPRRRWAPPLAVAAALALLVGGGWAARGSELRYEQGRFSDGWAAKRMHFWLPNTGQQRVELDVEIPDWPKLRGQRVEIRFEGRFLTSIDLEVGRKGYFFEVPRPSNSSDPVKLKLTARRAVWEENVPLRYRRRLAYILRELRYVGSET